MDIGFLLVGTLSSPFFVVKKFRNEKSRHVQYFVAFQSFFDFFFLQMDTFYNKYTFLWIELYLMTKRIRHGNCLFPLIGVIVAVTVSVIMDNTATNSYEGSYSQYILDVLWGQPIKWLLIHNCVKINEMNFFSLKLFPLIASGPHKYQHKIGPSYFTFQHPKKLGAFFNH